MNPEKQKIFINTDKFKTGRIIKADQVTIIGNKVEVKGLQVVDYDQLVQRVREGNISSLTPEELGLGDARPKRVEVGEFTFTHQSKRYIYTRFPDEGAVRIVESHPHGQGHAEPHLALERAKVWNGPSLLEVIIDNAPFKDAEEKKLVLGNIRHLKTNTQETLLLIWGGIRNGNYTVEEYARMNGVLPAVIESINAGMTASNPFNKHEVESIQFLAS